MTRTEFLKSAIRYLLFGLLAIAGLVAGSKAVTGNDCSSCPGKDICRGEVDCSKFLSNNDGRGKR